MKLFTLYLFITALLSHELTLSLVFANPINGSKFGLSSKRDKEEKEPSSQESNSSTGQQKQKRHRFEETSTFTQTQQTVRFYPPQSSDGAEEMELELADELEAAKPAGSSSSSSDSSSSSSSSLSSSSSSSAQESSSASSSALSSTSSSATSIAFNKTSVLPLGLLFKVREYLTQKDLGRLKHVSAYDPVQPFAQKTDSKFEARYNARGGVKWDHKRAV